LGEPNRYVLGPPIQPCDFACLLPCLCLSNCSVFHFSYSLGGEGAYARDESLSKRFEITKITFISSPYSLYICSVYIYIYVYLPFIYMYIPYTGGLIWGTQDMLFWVRQISLVCRFSPACNSVLSILERRPMGLSSTS